MCRLHIVSLLARCNATCLSFHRYIPFDSLHSKHSCIDHSKCEPDKCMLSCLAQSIYESSETRTDTIPNTMAFSVMIYFQNPIHFIELIAYLYMSVRHIRQYIYTDNLLDQVPHIYRHVDMDLGHMATLKCEVLDDTENIQYLGFNIYLSAWDLIVASGTCYVLCYSVFCTLCWQFLWIVHFSFPIWYSLTYISYSSYKI